MALFPTVFGRTRLVPLVIATAASLLLGGCSGGSTTKCANLIQLDGQKGAKGIDDGTLSPAQYQEIAALCTRAFEETRDPLSGLAVAKARYHLDQDDRRSNGSIVYGERPRRPASGALPQACINGATTGRSNARPASAWRHSAWPPAIIGMRVAPTTFSSTWRSRRQTFAISSSSCV